MIWQTRAYKHHKGPRWYVPHLGFKSCIFSLLPIVSKSCKYLERVICFVYCKLPSSSKHSAFLAQFLSFLRHYRTHSQGPMGKLRFALKTPLVPILFQESYTAANSLFPSMSSPWVGQARFSVWAEYRQMAPWVRWLKKTSLPRKRTSLPWISF